MKDKIGLVWTYITNIYAQISILPSVISLVMVMGVFYSSVASHYMNLWVFIVIVVSLFVPFVLFVIFIGIKYQFILLNKNSSLALQEKKMDILLRIHGINPDDLK